MHTGQAPICLTPVVNNSDSSGFPLTAAKHDSKGHGVYEPKGFPDFKGCRILQCEHAHHRTYPLLSFGLSNRKSAG